MTPEALSRWHASLAPHEEFPWPGVDDGKHMYSWDGAADGDAEFAGMHGDEMSDEDEGATSVL